MGYWLDKRDVEPFADFSDAVVAALSDARAILAWYSRDYPESRACQWEFTAAFLAAQQEADPFRRVLVINPEEGDDHLLLPQEIRGQNIRSAPSVGDLAGFTALAQDIATHLKKITSIQFWFSSERDYDIARGLRLLGFSNEEKHAVQLNAWIAGHGRSWLMDVAKAAQVSSKRDSWARIWIERFVAEEDRVKSWAAFRLFLRCVDKRFWIWGDDLVNAERLALWKMDAYRANIGTILDAIKENEKKLKETFIGHEVKENQLWPWMKRYS